MFGKLLRKSNAEDLLFDKVIMEDRKSGRLLEFDDKEESSSGK